MKTHSRDSSPYANNTDDDEKAASESNVRKSGERDASMSSPKSDKEPDDTARMNHGEAPMSDNDTTETELMSDETAVETAGTKK